MNSAVNSDQLQTIVVIVENKFGVLARVADLFARRGFNIYSLTVAPTRDDRLSRITIVVDVESAPLDQIVKQLFKLINVVEIQELKGDQSVQRELLIANVEAVDQDKEKVNAVIEEFYGKVLSDSDNQLIISVEASPSQIDKFENLIDQFNVKYLQRSGRIALPRIGRSVPSYTADNINN